jgi:hypothetical protein
LAVREEDATMKTRFVAVVVGVTAVALAAVSQAALPKKNAVYGGKATGGAAAPQCASPPCTDPYRTHPEKTTVRLDVSSTGRRLNFRTPQGCYFVNSPTGPNPWSYGRINRLRISKAGKFSGTRSYRDSRQANYVLDWTIKVSGRFVSSRRAEGTITYEAKESGRAGPTPRSCGRRSGPWTATRK